MAGTLQIAKVYSGETKALLINSRTIACQPNYIGEGRNMDSRMAAFSAAVLASVALSACQSQTIDEIAAGNRASYQRACSGAGFSPGTSDFDNCMNRQASTSGRELPENANGPAQPQQPMNCDTQTTTTTSDDGSTTTTRTKQRCSPNSSSDDDS
ncbi:hypothetical protein MPL3356_380054 [Mesorhizobium plurifarium]|uniref:Uncharacterized protein n=1 Tax=Mesorhizobium plurifarium TaxID=69974 RepID=A0A090FRQ9_MESPL|nr:hypothetical protein MPL3356_380054 [Mesorhizobium plurifarium]